MGLSHEQRRIVHRGRTFLFVSYDAEPAPPKKPEAGKPAKWYLVSSNNRWPAVPYVPGQDATEVDALCVAWLEAEVFGPPAPPRPAPPEMPQRFLRPGDVASA